MDMSRLLAYGRLQKYMNLSTTDLTVDVVKDIAAALGKNVDVTDQTVQQLVKLAQENAVDKLADVLGQPETVKKVVLMLSAPPPSAQEDDALIVCPHCSEYICLNR